MKRSEIIKVIYDTMKDNHFGQYGEFYKMAENVLDSIEQELSDDQGIVIYPNEWEEE